MIAFRDDFNKSDKTSKGKALKNLQKLLNIIYDDPEFYPGSHHKDIDISYIVQAIYKILFDETNKSVHIIIDRKENDSIDMTVDKIE
jgi:hypothetical protein